ncbi:uncharacterized protein LOC134240015 [Saccostrea cucullata]|uniref:uncharacterized protein LOC134240015 n=1 Tax=Saccostrea cuccullata TaxID=36930 RepID=UPI002ED24A63
MSFREGFEKLLSWTCKALGMDDFSRQCMVQTCTVCNGDTEFYCKTCESNLCLQCKERHNSYLDTVCHDVVIYREKFESIQKAESCGRHPEMLYEMYCQSCELPVFYKKTLINKIKATAQVKQVPLLSISDNLKKADVSLLLKETQSEIMKTEIVNEQLLKMVSKPVLKRSVKTHLVKLFRKLQTKLHFQVYTQYQKLENFYIDIKGDVKIQTDSQSKVMRMERTESPISLHYCAFAGDILLGFRGFHTKVNISYAGIVKQYDSIGEEIQTLQFDHKGENLFGDPRYLTKNCNEDIIVSDYTFNAVVVVDSAGKHRFSYTGPPPGSGLKPGLLPQGICTDALSHILVVDTLTDTVQMIDKDGNFLSILLTKPGSIHELYGLAYDHKTHLLIVGRGSSECTDIVSVYRYIERQNYVLTDT